MIEDFLEDEGIIELEAIDWVLDFVGFLFGRGPWAICSVKVVIGFGALIVWLIDVGFLFFWIEVVLLAVVETSLSLMIQITVDSKKVAVVVRVVFLPDEILFFAVNKFRPEIFLDHFWVVCVFFEDHSEESFGHESIFGNIIGLIFVDKINYFADFFFLVVEVNAGLSIIGVGVEFLGQTVRETNWLRTAYVTKSVSDSGCL